MFYALPAYSILMVCGWAAWLPRRVAPFALGGLGVALALFAAVMPFTVIAPAYARPPQLTQRRWTASRNAPMSSSVMRWYCSATMRPTASIAAGRLDAHHVVLAGAQADGPDL